MGILCILGQRVTGSLLNILWGQRVKSRVSLFPSSIHVAWYVTIAVPVIGGEQQLHPLEAMSLNMSNEEDCLSYPPTSSLHQSMEHASSPENTSLHYPKGLNRGEHTHTHTHSQGLWEGLV